MYKCWCKLEAFWKGCVLGKGSDIRETFLQFVLRRRMKTDSLIMAGTANSTQCKNNFGTSCVSCMFQAFSSRTVCKSAIVLWHWQQCVRTEVPCRISIMSFSSKISRQYDTRNGKQGTLRFYKCFSKIFEDYFSLFQRTLLTWFYAVILFLALFWQWRTS